MSEWWTYRPSDFLLFSPRTYYRMFELYHQQIWPAQLLAGAVAIAILLLLWKEDEWRGRVIAALLAACWLWVAIAFHLQRYATINWAARYFAVLFVIQSLLLVWVGVVRGRLTFDAPRITSRVSIGLFLFAVACAPLVGRLSGRAWKQVELFGLTPDATAVATLVLVALSSQRPPRALLVLPLCWCAVGGATLWALGSPEAFVPVLAAVTGLILAIRRSRTSRD